MTDSHRDYLYKNNPALARSGQSNIADLFRHRVGVDGHSVAVVDGSRSFSYIGLNQRVNRLSNVLLNFGLQPGDRIAILSKNRHEYLEAELAAAKTGLILCTLNCKLADGELDHCISLVSPKLVLYENQYAVTLDKLSVKIPLSIGLDTEYEAALAKAQITEPEYDGEAEDGFIILYTSGTTGLPKGALVSHRAMIARSVVFQTELGITRDDGFIAWAPFYHMASTDQSLATLLMGGTVFIIDGYCADRIIDIAEQEQIGWFVLIPGMIDQLIKDIGARSRKFRPKKIHCAGAMADLVPPHQIAEITQLLNAPYVNSFGSTETGLPPATSSLIAIGEQPANLSKRLSGYCEVRLVDTRDCDVPVGAPGELVFRGATLFSGYWQAERSNRVDFRNGWFHLGDVFKKQADGTIDFVDRIKYMIKSGGENIYPAEIERVLLSSSSVIEAAVIKQADEQWGEVPVAYIATSKEVSKEALLAKCRRELAAYKCPKNIHVISLDSFPRSTAGKIQRHKMESEAK